MNICVKIDRFSKFVDLWVKSRATVRNMLCVCFAEDVTKLIAENCVVSVYIMESQKRINPIIIDIHN